MAETTHRARALLVHNTPQLRPVWDQAAQWHLERRGEWPDWCYLPMSGWEAATDLVLPMRDPLDSRAASIAALGTWRMTQGIYRIDPDVYAALIETPLDGEIPAAALLYLPQWCVYVETPRLEMGGEPVYGFWAWLSYVSASQHVLHVTLDTAHGPMAHSLLLGTGTLAGALNTMLDLAAQTEPEMASALTGMAGFGEVQRAYLDVMGKAVNLLLYLCSTEAMPQRPANPPIQQTKRGPRIFPASGPTTWDVGVRMGSALRAAYAADQVGAHQGGSVRPHIRRAHWHGFRSGPMKTPDGQAIPAEKRRFELRWMPPIAVNLPDIEQLPATIYPVK